VLILAAAAVAEVTASGGDAIGGWLDDAEQARAGEALLCFGDLNFDYFADLNERNEDDEIFNSRDSFTTECDVGNREGQVFANSGTHGKQGREGEQEAKEKLKSRMRKSKQNLK
jgi:hypothetical protein